ncbi:MAG: transposase [Acidobacteria bacterium]|nr:transposase [Acidobacteriota bacterium]
MGRSIRRHIPNALVHVVQRCHNRASLLIGPGDKLAYLKALRETAVQMNYGVVSYCVMDNHIHLLLRTPPVIRNHTLAAFMHRLNNRFGHRFNKFHGRSGTLWSTRYRPKWVPFSALRLLKLIWYVEGNASRRRDRPIEASKWPWCSAYWFFRAKDGPVPSLLGEAMMMLLSGIPLEERPDSPTYLKTVLEVQKGPGWEAAIPHATKLRVDRRWLGCKTSRFGAKLPNDTAKTAPEREGDSVGRWDSGIERRALAALPGCKPENQETRLFPPRRRRRRKARLPDLV